MALNVIPNSESVPTVKEMPSIKNQPTVQRTLPVKLVKNSKRMNIMQFNDQAQQVKFNDWKRVRLQRENNCLLYPLHTIQEEPKFGGGSTYGLAEREEARNRRFASRYKPENQPWILTTNSSGDDKCANCKSFKGIREGGVGENSAYYIFIANPDGKSVSAYPVEDWYKFRPTQRYKTLSAEEAEEEYMRRNRRLNYFSLMMRKRLESEEGNEDSQADTLMKSDSDLKISEMDEWLNSSDEDDEDFDVDKKQPDKDNDKNKKKKVKSKKRNAPDNEAFEESDDGDEEGRELEYITDSSASESELEQQKEEGTKSVAEELGLKMLLSSDSEFDDANEDESSDEDRDSKHKEKPSKEKSVCCDKSVNHQGTGKENKSDGANLLRAAEDKKRTKRSATSKTQVKRYKSASGLSDTLYISGASESGISIEAISKYLKRKPMTLVDLIKKFKSKKTGLSREALEQVLTLTLQKIELNKQKIKGVTYYYLQKF